VLDHVVTHLRPDICLYDAGVDPHADDDLGRLCLSDDGLFKRDMLVSFHIVGAGEACQLSST
jgi:acetoin utilization deacetylase AcuC-like enzyme